MRVSSKGGDWIGYSMAEDYSTPHVHRLLSRKFRLHHFEGRKITFEEARDELGDRAATYRELVAYVALMYRDIPQGYPILALSRYREVFLALGSQPPSPRGSRAVRGDP